MADLSEFSLIKHYFSKLTAQRDDVLLGISDDCALLSCPTNQSIAVSIDTLVEGVHFFADVCPKTLGHKSLAVGLSDLAAMGAKPAWFTLALSLPEVDRDWLKSFSTGLAELAVQHNIQLVGGDTTRGPLTISIQVHGIVDPEKALKRSAAKVGDLVYVTGTLGDAGLALQAKLNSEHYSSLPEADLDYAIVRLEQPTPRVEIGQKLLGLASAAIDISDGLAADLGHILEQSGVGATIELNKLPLSETLKKLAYQNACELALSSGDDYELCFTIPKQHQNELETVLGDQCTLIGVIEQQTGLRLLDSGEKRNIKEGGYDHFS
jgi:thiamine-monophosphate kinase